ncbi:MAG: glycosyltransferase [Candidatus Bathyarchaeota archaeon]|nr:glycosyltransferase [Candidatus Bathyarchaeota archaeon]
MVKISFVSCYPPQRGQLSEYAYSLISELEKSPSVSKIDLITEALGEASTEKLSKSTTAYRLWKPDSPLSLLSIPLKILKLKPDIVHFNVHMAVFGRSRIANFVGLSLPFICKLMGFKTVVTLHNMVDKIDVEKTGYKNSFINRLSAFLVTKLIAASSAVTLTMKSHTEFFKERYRCKNAVTIPHGTWTSTLHTPIVQKTDSILYIGHSGPYKDIDLLLNSFKILEEKKRGLKLIMAGSSHPNYPQYLEKYKGKSQENLIFTGYVPENQLQALFEKANAVILPYRTCTGTSGVVHLASSYGTPIIATDLPEFRELAKEGCGLLISQHCSTALAQRIEQVIDDPKLALELKERNLNFAHSRSWDKVATNFCNLYSELMDGALG